MFQNTYCDVMFPTKKKKKTFVGFKICSETILTVVCVQLYRGALGISCYHITDISSQISALPHRPNIYSPLFA